MSKQSSSLISILVAVALIGIIALVWIMQKNRGTVPAPYGANVPEAQSTANVESTESINVNDIENELKGLDGNINQL